MVKCNTCHKTYKAIYEDTNQGVDCSATVFLRDGNFFLTGHYGSKVADMQLYKLNIEGNFQVGSICDGCIESLISSGDAILLKEDIW